jgi:hypothetical protein
MDDSIAPAHISQLRQSDDGNWMEIPADVGTVAADLAQIDKGLKVRFSRSGKCWAVFHAKHDDCPHNGTEDEYLVRTYQARMTRSGVYDGLDARAVTRMLQIMPGGRWGYDLADELDKARKAREKARDDRFREIIGEAGERAADALRRDLGLGPYKGRIFKP